MVVEGPLSALPPARSVFYLLRIALQEHSARWAESLAGMHGMECTKPQYAVLRSVQEFPGLAQSTAAQIVASDKATVGELLDRLETRGLLRREVDGADRRRRRLYLTSDGERLLADLDPAVSTINRSMLDRLEPDEQRQLVTLLRKLAAQEDA
jgi:DNA-binding MarR family transcriptional regulator